MISEIPKRGMALKKGAKSVKKWVNASQLTDVRQKGHRSTKNFSFFSILNSKIQFEKVLYLLEQFNAKKEVI